MSEEFKEAGSLRDVLENIMKMVAPKYEKSGKNRAGYFVGSIVDGFFFPTGIVSLADDNPQINDQKVRTRFEQLGIDWYVYSSEAVIELEKKGRREGLIFHAESANEQIGAVTYRRKNGSLVPPIFQDMGVVTGKSYGYGIAGLLYRATKQ